MIYLNHPFLTPEGILAELEKKICKNEIKPCAVSPIEQLQQSLKSIYFTQQGLSSKQIQTEILSEPFQQYPRLQYVLQQVFQNQTSIHIPDHLKDWQNDANHLDKLNQTYQYFTITPELRVVFLRLSEAYRKIALLVEKSTCIDLNAYQSAYRLMVLFYEANHNIEKNIQKIASQFVKLFKKTDHKIRFPYHDALIVHLHHLPSKHLISEIQEWRRFIQNEGFNALCFFAQADKISTVPKSLKDARMLAISHKYKNAVHDLSFANLCKHYVIAEEVFDKGLDVIRQKWPYKHHDHLPDVEITDKSKQFTWIKLHPHDKHALILGNIIPECCQHIGGHAEQCVLNGIQLQDNGFYVLLKAKKNSSTSPKMISHQINHHDYDIVAQSYAWRSQIGNLCLDSIEWNPRKVKESTLLEIMQEFAKVVMENHCEIKRVNVGVGGMTPMNFFPNASIPEKMKQGYQYFDSKTQYCIAQQFAPDIFQQIQLALLDTQQQKIISYLLPHFAPNETFFLVHQIAKIFTNIRPLKIQELLCLQQPLHLSDFESLTLEEYLLLPPSRQQQVSTVQKIWNSCQFKDLVAWLPHIADKDLGHILKLPDDTSNAIAHLFVNTPEILLSMLTRLSPNDRLDILNLPYYESPFVHAERLLFKLLQNLLAHPSKLSVLLNMLQPEDYVYLIRSHGPRRPSLLEQAIENAESFYLLFSALSAQDLISLLQPFKKHAQYFLKKASQFPTLLKNIFELLPSASLQDYIIYPDTCTNLLYHAATHEDSFEYLLTKIPSEFHEQSIFPQGYRSAILFRGATQLGCLQHFFKHIPESEWLNILFLKNTSNTPLFCFSAPNPRAFEYLLSKIPMDMQKSFFQAPQNQKMLKLIAPHHQSFKMVLNLFSLEEQRLIFMGPHVFDILSACIKNPDTIAEMFSIIPQKEHHLFINIDYARDLFSYPASLKTFLTLIPKEKRDAFIEHFFLVEEDEFALSHPSVEVLLDFLPEESQWNWMLNQMTQHTAIHALPSICTQKLKAQHQYEFFIELKKHLDNLNNTSHHLPDQEIASWVSQHQFNAQQVVWTLKVLPTQHHELFLHELHQSQSLISLMHSNLLLNFLTESKAFKDDLLNPSIRVHHESTAFIFFKHLMLGPLQDPIHENISCLLNHLMKEIRIETPHLLSDSEKFKLIKNILILQDFITHKRQKVDSSHRWFKSSTRQEEIEAASQIIGQLRHPQEIDNYILQSHLNVLKSCRVYESLDTCLMQTKKLKRLP